MTKLLRMIIKGISERGLEKPSRKRASLIKNPEKIRKTTPNPTEKSTVSNLSSSFNLSSLVIMSPGTNVKYTKPITCLAIGMSKITVTNTIICKNNVKIRKFVFRATGSTVDPLHFENYYLL
jgi:hypothetical protein